MFELTDTLLHAGAIATLLDLVAKATVVMLVAFALGAMFRRANHALLRATMWQAAIVALLVLPVATAWGPPLRWTCLPPVDVNVAVERGGGVIGARDSQTTTTDREVSVDPLANQAAAPGLAAGSTELSVPHPVFTPAGASPSVIVQSATDDRTPTRPSAAGRSDRAELWSSVFWGVYGVGALVLGLRLLGSWIAAERLRRSGRAVEPGEWHDALERAKRELGLRGQIALVMSDTVGVPATVGWWRPTVLVPTKLVTELRSADREAIVMHELVHIQRADTVWQILLGLVQIVYWPHLLVWLIGPRLAVAREQVCDQVCLHHLGDGRAYQTTLIEVACGATRSPLAALGIAMARSSRIEKRLDWIQRGYRVVRGVVRWPVRVMLLVATSAAVGTLGPLQLARAVAMPEPARSAAAERSDSSGEDAPLAVSNGPSIELVRVGEHSKKASRRWWQPDGTPIDEPVPYERLSSTVRADASRDRAFEFIMKLNVREPEEVSVRFESEPSGTRVGPMRPERLGRAVDELRVSAVTLPSDAEVCRVMLGVADGAWNDVVRRVREGERISGGVISGGLCDVAFSRPMSVGPNQTRISVTYSTIEDDVRIVAVDAERRVHEPSEVSGGGTPVFYQLTVTFDVAVEDVEEIAVQHRPYTWLTIDDVSLRPGQRTSPRHMRGRVEEAGDKPQGVVRLVWDPVLDVYAIGDAEIKTWDALRARLLAEADRAEKIVELGVTTDRITRHELDTKRYQLTHLAHQAGYRHLSYIGVPTGDVPDAPPQIETRPTTRPASVFEGVLCYPHERGVIFALLAQQRGDAGHWRTPDATEFRGEVDRLAAQGPRMTGRHVAGLMAEKGLEHFPLSRLSEYQWFELGCSLSIGLTRRYMGRDYVLLRTRDSTAMYPCRGGPHAWRVVDARVATDTTGRPTVRIELDEAGGVLLNDLTRNNMGRYMAIVVNGKVLSAPRIQSAVSNVAMIAGDFTPEQAEEIARTIRAAAEVSTATGDPADND